MKISTHRRLIKKEEAREQAISWQRTIQYQNYTYSELAQWQAYFEQLGRKYGLLREFRENGII